MGVINFIVKQLVRNVNNPKGIEYIIRVFNNLPIKYKYIDKQLQRRLHYLYTQEKLLTLISVTKK